MDQRLQQALSGQTDSYILPFLWLHGEPHEVLREEIDAIEKCGIREFCAESRTHEDFGKEKWWEDFGFLLEEAKRRNMRVWLLDDKRFPTGYANGYFETHPRTAPRFLREDHMDVKGPRKNIALEVFHPENETLNSVIAYRRTGEGFDLDGEALELTAKVQDGLVFVDIPEGTWRVFFFLRSDWGPSHRLNWIDMLRPESCHAMIENVYQPHYEHFKEYFGNTFAGFFSDEPSFGNETWSYHSVLGKRDMPIPWREDLEELMAQEAGVSKEEIHALLPGLWFEIKGKSSLIRSYYMEAVTKLYAKNFCWMLGDWCRERGVMYIGHIIEDNNTHMRLGYGAGHFYRSLDGQDMAGMDIVLCQIIPGMEEMPFEIPVAGHSADPTFFHYTLAKLASSHAHIQPLKKNRAMCEIFGAFGWVEGLPYMRQLADHMLVNGINYYVPHAFDPKYPDKDCPPHFYVHGKNPQYPAFQRLMAYMQRASHVLSGGIHQAPVAVFYNAEGEWSGGKNMLFQEICKTLTKHQIDFDIVPEDYLDASQVKEGKLWVNEESYSALLISESEILPLPLLQCFAKLADAGLPVIFANSLPERASEYGVDISEYNARFETVALEKLPTVLRERGMFEITAQPAAPNLVYYHTKRGNADVFMLRNSDVQNDLDTTLTLPVTGDYVRYDPWDNTACRGRISEHRFHCRLAAGDSMLLCFGEVDASLPELPAEPTLQELSLSWDIDLQECGGEKTSLCTQSDLFSVTSRPGLTRFAGTIEYRTKWQATGDETTLDLGEVGEIAHVFLNGIDCGVRAFPPYRFAIAKALRPGENDLQILVVNNLAYRERDMFSRFSAIPPSGILGPVTAGK